MKHTFERKILLILISGLFVVLFSGFSSQKIKTVIYNNGSDNNGKSSRRAAPSRSGRDDMNIPKTISARARQVLRDWDFAGRDITLPEPNDLEAWEKVQKLFEDQSSEIISRVIEEYEPTIISDSKGGVDVLDIRPYGWHEDVRILVYVHGGAYTLYSADSSLVSSVPMAQDTGFRIISIDYTLAPLAKWDQMTDEVISVVEALLKEGHTLKNIAIYGDSSGASLAAGSVLKMIDQGLSMPSAVVLISPWSDIGQNGDTYYSLKHADPVLNYDKLLKKSALAYAPRKDHKNPYVSPVYSKFSEGFPPTLIQAGTREIFLSNAVRLYQALDRAGVDVKLDLYEGMWHVFQTTYYDLPESRLARQKIKRFLDKHVKD